MANRPFAVGAHIYSGAFSLGVKEHFDLLGQCEEGPWGAATFELNFPGVPHPLDRADWPVASYRDRVTLVFANPPCAPWSPVGSHLGLADPRIAFTRHSIDLALGVRPDFFVLESVPGAWSQGRVFYEQEAERFRRAGWATTVLLTSAILHGGPQNRNRFHLIAHRYQLDIQFPTVTWRDVPTVGQLIGDLDGLERELGEPPLVSNHVIRPLKPRDHAVIRELAPGEKFNHAAQRLRDRGIEARNWRMISARLRADSTTNAVVDLDTLIHPTRDRLITLREGARLCGYPDDFVFAVDPARKDGMARNADVTQAVLPPMGRYLSGLCRKALEGDRARPEGLSVIDFRSLARPLSKRRYVRTREQELNGE